MTSKLSVNALIKRSHRIFSARLKERGPVLAFWLEHGLVDWIEANPNKIAFTGFYDNYRRLTYDKSARADFAELGGFGVRNFPDLQIKLVVTLSPKKGWYLLSLMKGAVSVLEMELRFEEARDIFDPIYYYFLT